MKRLFIITILSIVLTQLQAQTSDEKATSKADKLTKELGLSAEQKEKIKNFYLEEEKKTAELKTKYGKTSDKSQFHKEAKTLRDQTEKNILYILNATQKTKYESLHSHKEKDKK